MLVTLIEGFKRSKFEPWTTTAVSFERRPAHGSNEKLDHIIMMAICVYCMRGCDGVKQSCFLPPSLPRVDAVPLWCPFTSGHQSQFWLH
eukprot:4605212-Amphidinium_carterae.1